MIKTYTGAVNIDIEFITARVVDSIVNDLVDYYNINTDIEGQESIILDVIEEVAKRLLKTP